jgi:hypothetical protein
VQVTPDGQCTVQAEGGTFKSMGSQLNKTGEWNRLRFSLAADVAINRKKLVSVGTTIDPPPAGTLTLRSGGPMDFANLFVRETGEVSRTKP